MRTTKALMTIQTSPTRTSAISCRRWKMMISMRRGRSVEREEGVLFEPRFVISNGVSAVAGTVICIAMVGMIELRVFEERRFE